MTTNGGASWTGYTGQWASYLTVNSISCASISVCWIAGTGQGGAGEVAESTDGGQTWTQKSPAFLADSGGTRSPNAIDCVSATTCWLAGWGHDGDHHRYRLRVRHRRLFGSRKGSHLQVISPEQIKVVAPAGSGTVNVRVHTAGGITAVTAKDRYRY
ncbi:MAG TPA: hypothetical protein VGH77_15260 [Streptosporangiaceae bacterium]